ncbi:TnpV protein [Marasmitruncus massiliensis]|uniref:TnpV protein n=1 Tax=Marasmitruncus massiliensis TaxID=1944642 RepID=UPI000C7C345D|nr:TnpV protein [Marasmitruncus massiliensis]
MIELDYIEIDGLLYPNIALDDEGLYSHLGKYGNLRLKYLHGQKPEMYRELLFLGKLSRHCADIEKSAFDMVERIRGQYLEQNPPPLEDTLARIQVFTLAQDIADEYVLHDLIYA